MLSIFLLFWAIGCVLYSIYSIAVLRDAEARIAAALMGVGGLVFLLGPKGIVLISLGSMLVGTLLSLNLFPANWIIGEIKPSPVPVDINAPAAPPDEPSYSPFKGGAMMLAALPILALGGVGLWYGVASLIIALMNPGRTPPDPVNFLSYVAVAGVGGGIFLVGYGKSGLKGAAWPARAAAIGVAVLAFGWIGFMLVLGMILPRPAETRARPGLSAVSTADASVPPSEPAPGALTSADGRLTLAMPPCWKAESIPGRALYAACGDAEISITESPYGGDTESDQFVRVQRAEKKLVGRGAVVEQSTESRYLKGKQPLDFFRFRLGNDRLFEGEFTLWNRSYSLVWKNLGPEDTAALDRSLDALAAASIPKP